jgi:NADPH:quinone reductase-like Zn-dependent oxidoreductase
MTTTTMLETTAPTTKIEARTMRAMLQSGYGGTEVLRVGRAPVPAPGEGEVLVRVGAAGLDRGTWHLMTGRPYLMRVMGFGFSGPKHPVPGLDLAGTVVAVGPNVTRFRVGDEVFGLGRGAFGELACAREDKLARKPRGLSMDEAAVLGVSAITALQAIDAAAVKAGDRVLVVGASGGVGTYAVQIAKALGAEVTGVCRTSKVEAVRALGADHVIDYARERWSDGRVRWDVIIDCGGNTALSALRRAMTETGRCVFVGGENGGDFTAGFGRILAAMLLAPFVKQRFVPLANREHFEPLERIAALVEEGKVRPRIDRRVDLAEVPSALDAMVAGQITGKVVVRLDA